MDEKKLLRLTIILSLIGVCILFLISKTIKPDAVSINSITEEMIGRSVIVSGNITSISSSSGRSVIYLDKTKTPCVAFQELQLLQDDKVIISGIVEEYKEKIQIRIEKIEKI